MPILIAGALSSAATPRGVGVSGSEAKGGHIEVTEVAAGGVWLTVLVVMAWYGLVWSGMASSTWLAVLVVMRTRGWIRYGADDFPRFN